jgi:hypothetical protein
MKKIAKVTIATFIFLYGIVGSPFDAEAKFFFHATKKAAAKKIMAKGFSLRKANPKARYGSGGYLAESKKLALRERPTADAIVKFKDTQLLRRNIISTRKLSSQQLKKISGDRDLRGNIHHHVISGDLAKKMGKASGRRAKVIAYPSARGKGENIFIPQKVYNEHPGIVKPVRVETIGK